MTDTQSNWIDFLIATIPVAQTGIWAAVAVGAVVVFRKPLQDLAVGLTNRVHQGDDIKTPWFTIEKQEKLENLKKIEASESKFSFLEDEVISDFEGNPLSVGQWSKFRENEYNKSRNLFLVHAIKPSDIGGQKFDTFIYVKRHKGIELNDVKEAEFYLGKSWGDEIFKEEVNNGQLGLRTSAYGTFLCICKVTFRDGESVMLSRYIDFEMGET